MTIGLLTKPTIEATSGIIESTNYFDNRDRSFNKGQEIRVDDTIYYRYADKLVVPEYDANKSDYKLNDIVYRDGRVNFVNGINGAVAKQPENYTNTDTSLETNTWTSRYLKIGTFVNGKIEKTIANGEDVYSYSFTNNAGVIFWDINNRKWREIHEDEWNIDSIGLPSLGDTYPNKTLLMTGDGSQYTSTEISSKREEIGAPFIGSKGEFKMISKIKDFGNGQEYYSYSRRTTVGKTGTIQATYQSSLEVSEAKAIVTDNYIFEPKSFIIRGNDLYMRTNKDVAQEPVEATEITTKILENLNEIEWGWDILRPIKSLLPFDDKKYTAIEATNGISFTLKSDAPFDMIALNNVFANTVRIDVYDTNDNIIDTVFKSPKNEIIRNNKKRYFSTILVVYLKELVYESQKIKITMSTRNGKIILGEGCLADSLFMGYTDMKFKNSSIDYSAKVKDEWGWSDDSDGNKVRTLDALVKFETTDFDDIARILLDLSGRKVIFDGSDNIENEEIDNKNFFLSTQIIGKAKVTEQSTRVDRDRLSSFTEYNISIEEDV